MTSPSFQSLTLLSQVFRKASADAIDLISALLEYTPTQRLSAIEAMCHSFFDELRDPMCRFPDSRHPNSSPKEMPKLFDFSKHGRRPRLVLHNDANNPIELSIAPEKNIRLVPPHARRDLVLKGLDLEGFVPLSKEEMMARLD